MRQRLFLLFQAFFSRELLAYVNSFKEAHHRTEAKLHENKALKFNYPIGEKVFLRSNEPDPLIIGEVVDYWLHEKSGRLYPVIRDFATGRLIHSNDPQPHYYEPEKSAALAKLNWAEQWNVMNKYYQIDRDHQLRREQAYQQEKKGLFAHE